MKRAFFEQLIKLKDYEELKKQQKKPGILQITGPIDASKCHLFSGLTQEIPWKLIVTYSEQRAREWIDDLAMYEEEALYYPAKDILFYQSDIRGNVLTRERMEVLEFLENGHAGTIVTTFDGLMDRIIKPGSLMSASIHIKVGDQISVDKLKEQLISIGYEKNYGVEEAGQFAIRGGIVDVFPVSKELPVRIELWGDEVDTIRSMDVESQRSVEQLEEALIYPVTELVLTPEEIKQGLDKISKETDVIEGNFRAKMMTEEAYRLREQFKQLEEEILQFGNLVAAESFLGYFKNDTVSFLEYLRDRNASILLDEPARLSEKGRTIEKEFQESMEQRLSKGYVLPGQANILFMQSEIWGKVSSLSGFAFTTIDQTVEHLHVKSKYDVMTKSINSYNRSIELLLQDLKQYQKKHYSGIVVSGSRTRAANLAKDLLEAGIPCFYSDDYEHEIKDGEIMVCYGKVKRGFEYPLLRFFVIAETDIFGSKVKKKKKKQYDGERIHDFAQLKIGDYVVHENHGLGIYRGIEKVEIDKVTKDYIKIEYDKGGALFILASNLEYLQKFAGADAKKPKLNKLGTQEWQKTKTKVRGAVKEIAKELVDLYAIREHSPGYSYGPDTIWQHEFEELFPYEETDDQLMAIEAAKKDMESTRNMDRLVCGDVGFGKTEIAIRAAFKAIQEGKQVVYLVPTTILAQQHYNTFSQRMKDFPVRVDLLCRFKTPAEQKKTLQDLKKGWVDVVIGTHRLLSKDVQYKDLGLLIIDEEQRFGVTHKEKIKQIKNNIDVLTLTATPIPRTLHMSLIGIRDMSVLEEAPNQRTPIQTYVMEYNEEMIREAINREMGRNGQVFYVFNRVKQIAEVADKIRKLVPDATVAYAHGQMNERELEDIMYQFINGDIDVLVSTTIIETGLDISNVNTMIIQDADNLGLSQLYQLRGRVGRSNRTAYAFLMYKKDKLIKEVAEKRLSAIREYTELGSGIKIAMKDLEIRGAGNLLGASQHGHMEAVGYDLYCKMLTEAIRVLKGESYQEGFETVLDVNVNAFIPSSYIPNEYQKLDIYKRIAGIENREDESDMIDELVDRFGDLPQSVETLLRIARLKGVAHSCFLTEIVEKNQLLRFGIYQNAPIRTEAIPEFVNQFQGAMGFNAVTKPPTLTYRRDLNAKTQKEDVLDLIERILELVKEQIIITEEEK